MNSNKFDFLVLGGGSAGYAAARTAHELGKRVAVVDGGNELSGLCILRGCMPSKTLIYSAEVLHLAQKGDLFGFVGEKPVADMAAMQKRKKEIIKEFSDYRKEQLQDGRFSLFRGNGTFVDGSTIELDDGNVLKAEKILISTGSVTYQPEVPGLKGCPLKTSDDVLDLDYLPEECIVLGGGVVACEMAQFLSRVGCKVTQLQRSEHILKGFSSKASKVIEEAFRSENINLLTGVSLQSFESLAGDQIRVNFLQHGHSHELQTSFLFNAMGRKPATFMLGLDKIGVDCLRSGHISTNHYQQSNISNIYAAGDCAGPHEIVHVAIRQGETVAKHAFGQDVAQMNYDHLLTVVFTDPQLARVGLTLEEITDRGMNPVSSFFPFDDHGKSILMEAKLGYVAIHADQSSGRILGAECVSKDAGELIHSLSVAVALGATPADLLKADWYHPTLSEIWTYPLEDLDEKISSNPCD